jgi:hypothetical protein
MKKAIVGLRGIDGAIRSLRTRLTNVNDDVQAIAVAIVTHAAGDGNGDVSRALTLAQVVNKSRTMNVAFLIGWFRYFGNCNINLKDDKVGLLSRDSKAYRGGFDVKGAEHNKWYDAFGADGKRAPWYAGPAPAEFQPLTIGDAAADFERFVKREADRLNGTTTVNGKDVPTFNLTDDDRQQLNNALDLVKRVAATIARHERVANLEAEIEKTKQQVDEPVEELISGGGEKMVA